MPCFSFSHQLSISIHAPREGGDPPHRVEKMGKELFQSTPPARGATPLTCTRGRFQSIFQSTPPARGATLPRSRTERKPAISIHAPREGGD